MEQLEQKHIDFLRAAAADDKHTHPAPEGIDLADLEEMVNGGLLIKYNGLTGPRFAVTSTGAQYAKSFGDSPEIEKIAVQFVMSKGYNEDAAKQLVQQYGAEHILRAMNQENGDARGQGEVKVPTDEKGVPTMKFFKP